MYNNKALADKLTTELTGLLNYVVTDDIQLFSKDMQLGNEDYVPVVLTTITSFSNENRYIDNVSYQLQFRVRVEWRDAFYDDITAFKSSQQTETYGSYFITKVVENEVKGEKQTIKGVDYLDYTIEMRYTYSLALVGTQTILKVDDVDIPFISCDVIHDIVYVSNQGVGNGYRLTNDVVTIMIPLIVANAKVLELYDAVNTNAYNQVYDVEIDGTVKELVLKRGQYTFTNTATVTSLILTFETHYPRVTVEIDGDVLPVTAYQYMGKKIINTGARTGDIQKGTPTSKVRTWAITFVVSDATAMNKLIADAYGGLLDITYTLDIGLAQPFTVTLGDVAERYTETGDMTLECQFVEVVA